MVSCVFNYSKVKYLRLAEVQDKLSKASKVLRLAEVQDLGICRSMSMPVCERGRQIKP